VLDILTNENDGTKEEKPAEGVKEEKCALVFAVIFKEQKQQANSIT
jgi:hypothetical protein